MEKPVCMYKLRARVIGACHRRQLPVRSFIVSVKKREEGKRSLGREIGGRGFSLDISRIMARNGQIIERNSSVSAGAREHALQSGVKLIGRITGFSVTLILIEHKPSNLHIHTLTVDKQHKSVIKVIVGRTIMRDHAIEIFYSFAKQKYPTTLYSQTDQKSCNEDSQRISTPRNIIFIMFFNSRKCSFSSNFQINSSISLAEFKLRLLVIGIHDKLRDCKIQFGE